MHRLNISEIATVIFIVVKDTQSEEWFKRAVQFDESDDVKYVKNINELTSLI